MVGDLRTLVHIQPIGKKIRNRHSSKQAISNFDALTVLQVATFSFDTLTIFPLFQYAFDALLCYSRPGGRRHLAQCLRALILFRIGP